MAEGYTSANQTAAQVINGELPAVAAENANYGAYQADSAAGVDTSFSLQDEGAVSTLLSGPEAFLPQVSVAAAADMAWNRKGIQLAVTQGILLGESIPKIAKRMQGVGARNRAQAVRWARTYTTAAENAGRIASYERARSMGIKLKQEWLATLDGRTRHSHRQLDGERREVGKKFSNGCRYPGDPQAAYAEICNCRCTLVAAVDGIDQDAADRFSRLPAGTTYEQWKAGKAESAHDSTGRTMGEFMQTPLVKKQLAKRGLTEAQGRKLLSEQLKADGATGHQFRTMTKQQQRKAWNGALDRKKPTEMEIVRKDIKPVNEQLYGSLRAYVERHGGRVYRGVEFVTRYLDMRGAGAANIGDVIFLRQVPSTSEVLEETYHFKQYLRNDYGDLHPTECVLRREVDAQNWLLSVTEQYKIPDSEVELTKRNLAYYEKELSEFLGGVS